MENKVNIQIWLKQMMDKETLFLSIRFKTSPRIKIALCKRCKTVFRCLFQEILGRRWYKLYPKSFLLIGFQEYGQRMNMHAHFLLGIQNTKHTSANVIQTLKSLSGLIKKDIWDSDEDKATNPKNYGDDIMIKSVFSDGVFIYATKEIKIADQSIRIDTDTIILDTDIFY